MIGAIDETRPAVWSGGFYELYIEFAGENIERLVGVLTALWEHHALDGPYRDHRAPFGEQQRIAPASGVHPEDPIHLYGAMRLAADDRIPCASVATHAYPRRDDSLVLYVTEGTLLELGRDPDNLSAEVQSWLDSLDRRQADIAEAVFAVFPFELATIGREALTLDAVDALRSKQRPGWLPAHLLPEGSGLRFTTFKGHS
jgi:hypothetical protein